MCGELSHEFRVVRVYRTFSMYSVTGEARCVGCFCPSSGWFKHIEPPRTSIVRDKAMCGEFCHRSLGWFDGNRTFSSYIVTGCAGSLCPKVGWFKPIEPQRTFSYHSITKVARCEEFCHSSLGWFDFTEPSVSTSLQGNKWCRVLLP